MTSGQKAVDCETPVEHHDNGDDGLQAARVHRGAGGPQQLRGAHLQGEVPRRCHQHARRRHRHEVRQVRPRRRDSGHDNSR